MTTIKRALAASAINAARMQRQLRSPVIDRPWAIVFKTARDGSNGLLYGLGTSAADAWHNAVLVMNGYELGAGSLKAEITSLKRRGYVARKVEVRMMETVS